LYGALEMLQPDEGMGPRVSVDTILLAHFIRFPARARVMELGCAHGAISLILALREKLRGGENFQPFQPIDAIDINPELIEMAAQNAEINGLSDRVLFGVADLREHRRLYQSESYDVVVMNPPYDEPGKCRPSRGKAMASAKHGDNCNLSDVVSAAKYLLRNGGKFFLVIRAKRLGELISLLSERNVRAKKIRSVHPRPDRDASVVLVEAARASGEGLAVEPPLFICGPDGEYTEDLLNAYRLEGGTCLS
jgi:tRNA1(Val) A37 N6-methylase TrmN6